MPTQLVREIFNLQSYLPAVSEQSEAGFYVKGFVSVESVDSVGHLAPPEEFNVESFLSASTVLVDHDYWVDEYGNMVTAGKVAELYPAVLAKGEDENLWLVKDIKTGEVKNQLEKASVPHLEEGARGLFSVIHVTQKGVIEKIQSGELGGFSWKGLVSAKSALGKNGEPIKVLHNIDLFEVTIAKSPINKDAVLVVGKSEGEAESLVVYAVELSKAHYPTPEVAKGYLDSHRLSSALKEDATNFCALQSCNVDLSKLVRVQMLPGVEVIAGPMAKSVVEVPKVNSDFISGFKDVLYRDSNMSRVTIEATDIVVSSKSVKDEAPKEAPVQEATTVAKSEEVKFDVEAIVKQASEAVMSQLSPALAEIAKSIAVLQKSAEAPVAEAVKEEVATPEETKQETADVIEEFEDAPAQQASEDDPINLLVESIKMLAQEVDSLKKNSGSNEVEKLVADLRKSIPTQTAREETVEKSRRDKNSVFDTHPILGGSFLFR